MARTTQGLRRAAGSSCLSLGVVLVIAFSSAGRAAAQNTSYGTGALSSNTTGTDNSAFGYGALNLNTTGFENTASGFDALFENTTGIENTASGAKALVSNTTGISNTASGAKALVSNTTGISNTASGAVALGSNTTGISNTASGAVALGSNTTGGNNIAIGYLAGNTLTTGNNNIEIGNPSMAADSKTIRIGDNSVQTATYIAGIKGAAITGGEAGEVVVSSRGRLGVRPSAARFKRNIQAMGASSGALMKLRPVTFIYKSDPSNTRQYGLVAEQVREIYPELVTHDGQGKLESVRYQELAPMLLNEVQRQQRDLAELRAENSRLRSITQQAAQVEHELAELRAENRTLRSTLEQVQGRVEQMAAELPTLAHR